MTAPDFVEIYSTGAGKIGAGYRRVFVLSIGPKSVHLYEPTSGDADKLKRDQFDAALIGPVEPSKRLLSITRRVARERGDKTKRTKRLIKAMRGQRVALGAV